jgi:hypothetical protein
LNFVAAEVRLFFFHDIRNVFAFVFKGFHPIYAADNVARSNKHSRNAKFLNAVCVCSRSIENHNSFFRAFFDWNIVYTRARASHRFKRFRHFHIVHFEASQNYSVGIRHFARYLVFFAGKFLKTNC